MTAVLSDVLDAIVAQGETISGLRGYPYPPFNPSPPSFHISVAEGADQTMRRGVASYDLELYVAIAAVSDRAGYAKHVGLMDADGAGSFRAAVMAGNGDGTFGGLDGVSVACIGFRSLNLDEIAALQVYGAVYPATVTITKG